MNQTLRDALIRHQVYLQRLATGGARGLIKTIDQDIGKMAQLMRSRLDTILGSRRLSRKQQQLIARLTDEVNSVRAKHINQGRIAYSRDVEQLIAQEIQFTEKLIIQAAPFEFAIKPLEASVMVPRIIGYGAFAGQTYAQWFDGLLAGDRRRITCAIRSSLDRGHSVDTMVRALIGTRRLNYTDGVLVTTRRHATALARTITNGVSNTVRQEVFVNNDLVRFEIYTATLDGRTTLLCAGLDGRRYEKGEGPLPPLHVNCRSLRNPVVDPTWIEKKIGQRPFVRDTRTRKFREQDFKEKAKRDIYKRRWDKMTSPQRNEAIAKVRRAWIKKHVGTVPETLTFGQWFDRQGGAFQKDYLGAARYRLYREGKVTIKQFTDSRGMTLTLDELKARTRGDLRDIR